MRGAAARHEYELQDDEEDNDEEEEDNAMEMVQKRLRRTLLVIPNLLFSKPESLLGIILGTVVAQCFFVELLWPSRLLLVTLVGALEGSILCSRVLARFRAAQPGLSLALPLCLQILVGVVLRRLLMCKVMGT